MDRVSGFGKAVLRDVKIRTIPGGCLIKSESYYICVCMYIYILLYYMYIYFYLFIYLFIILYIYYIILYYIILYYYYIYSTSTVKSIKSCWPCCLWFRRDRHFPGRLAWTPSPGPRILLSTSHESLPDGPERPGRQPIFGLEISGKCLNMDGVYNGKSYERPYEHVMKKNEHGMI